MGKRARARGKVEKLRAPESGTVQQRTVHTIGGVVEPARTLMVVVPGDGALAVEARLLNRDAGFVREGDQVTVKVEAFPFTRYGTLPGRVVSISRDAVPDPKLGATYLARIQLTRSAIMIDGRPTPLTSGLGVVADIRTGSRRIVSYLLSPVQTSVAQAGRER